MKVRIYQIPLNMDTTLTVFRDLPAVLNQYGGSVPAELYQKVYEGEVTANNLEQVHYIFNQAHPEDYTARSLSMSDVVEVIDKGQSTFYFCCQFGFEQIDFDVFKVKEAAI